MHAGNRSGQWGVGERRGESWKEVEGGAIISSVKTLDEIFSSWGAM